LDATRVVLYRPPSMRSTAQAMLATALAFSLVGLPVPRAMAAKSRAAPKPVPSASTDLLKARQAQEAGEFERSVRAVEAVLKQYPDLAEATRAEAYRLLGLGHLYLGNEAEARKAYATLLEIQPDYELPRSAPPKVLTIYERIVDELRLKRLPPVTLRVADIPDIVGDQPLSLRAAVENYAPGLKAKLYYRRPPKGIYSSSDFQRDAPTRDDFTAVLPAYDLKAESTPYRIEYYVEVADAARRRLAGHGTLEEPRSFQVLADPTLAPKRPWFKNPWVWVAGGAVVAVAATTIVVIATTRRP
jgi:tetratricopeptide (TPR) repeat protein